MMRWAKLTGIWGGVAAVLSTIFFLVGGFSSVKKLYFEIRDQKEIQLFHEEVKLFDETSGIISHTLVDGKVRLRYQICNPPVDVPMYYYSIWINGVPNGELNRIPAKNHYDISNWWHPIHCTEGFLGAKEFDGKVGDTFVVTWYFKVDGGYDTARMEYTIT